MPNIQIKRGLSAALVATNPIVASGEPVFEIDTLKLKIGDGITAYSGLSVVGSGYYALVSHNHSASEITDFNTSVSGVLSKTISVFTASDNQPPASNFATLDTRNSILVLEFDATTEESAYFTGVIDEGRLLTNGITVRIWWMADTATTGNVRWGVQFEKTGTDLDSDSFDTNAQVTSAANGTSGIESIASIAITSIDSLSAGDRYRLRVYRVAADATNDTMTGDAQLVAVEVRAI